MVQQVQCSKCGSLNHIKHEFCSNCGRRIQYACPSCGVSVEVMSASCPNCNVLLPCYIPLRLTGLQFQIDEKQYEYINELLWNLLYVGKLKQLLPLPLRGWCNALLFVQVRDLSASTDKFDGYAIAAGTDMWVFDLEALCKDECWNVIKYVPGDWEKLVEPTVKITLWLLNRGGIDEKEVEKFNKSIKDFHKHGRLELF